MLVADTYLGHESEADVADRLAADPRRVVLSDTDRQRSRVRTETAGGRDLGIVIGRDLRDGDVLETEDGTLVVVELAAVDALVLDLADADLAPATALELGHAVGNRHWDLALREGEALFPATESRERMAATVEELVPGVEYRFEAVSPGTFDDGTPGHHGHGGTRSIPGGHGGGHSHAHGGDHPHSHGEGTSHAHGGDHSHGDDHTHSHGEGHSNAHNGDSAHSQDANADGGDPA